MKIEYPSIPAWRSYPGRVAVIVALAIVAVVYLWSRPAFAQSLAYHNFADDRHLLGVPNCLNVLSNVPFVIVGAWGLWFVLSGRGSFLTPAERWPYVLFFAGLGLTAFGSAYYHLRPDNDRLMWDRLPMSVAFMALFAAVVAERLDVKLGTRLLAPLVVLGVTSVLYWQWTEQQGRGDLRFYYFVQFYPMLALPLILLLFPPRYTRTADLVIAFAWYGVAKLCEHPGDGFLYEATGHVVSGHTLKHLTAAAGAYWVLRMLQQRRPVTPLAA